VSVPPLIRLLRELPGDLGAAAAALSPSEWERLPEEAERHGLSGLLVDGLVVAEKGDSPHFLRAGSPATSVAARPGQKGDSPLFRLRSQARNAAAHAMKLHRLLLETLVLLEKREVVPVLMKGWGFGVRYWPDPLLRPASDVDILVEPEALTGIERTMAKLGLSRFVDAGMDDVEEEHHHLAFHGPRGIVEVHFRLTAGFGGAAMGGEAFFHRCTSATLEGHAVRYLAPEDELVYMAVHAAQHLFLRIGWLHDLKLLSRAPLDWDQVIQVARDSSLRAATHAALFLAHDALGAEIPPAVLKALAPTRLHARAVRRAFTDDALVTARLATAKSASALRATLSDNPIRAARHLAQGALRNVRRRIRA
jgi:hypothetical protein